jgi:D-alanyl-D-alanine carboxypeptidase
MDASSGRILMGVNSDATRFPASLTKLMTLYMTFEALRDRRIQFNQFVPVSAWASAQPPSKLGLQPGDSLTVEQAILALVTKSANDAAAALGEHMGQGSEDRFAQMMTLKARSLGMAHSVFRNASGLPDAEQVSTARDMALLGRRLMKDFPDRFGYFATPHFRFRGRVAFNHNRLLQEYEGADGIKTGYVNDSGFNLVASANRSGVRLVAAVFGGRTGRERDRHMVALLDQGFREMGVAPRQVVSARRALPQMLPGAQAANAAPRAAARPAALAALPLPPTHAHAARRPADKLGARQQARIEQGDTDRHQLRRPARPSTPTRAVAVTQGKPGKQVRG